MKVIIGGLQHETSTFTPIATSLQDFEERYLLYGEEILRTFRQTNTPIGGFIEGAELFGIELIPTIFAEAHPGGPIPREVFDILLEKLLAGIRKAGTVAGVLLDLHGAMLVGSANTDDNIDDVEGYVLAAVRKLVGPKVPVVAQLDIHANVSQQMVAQADVLIGRETYPEIDMAERGRECVDVLVQICRDGVVPTMALHPIPMVWGHNQVTTQPPMLAAIAELKRIKAQPGVISASIATCYALADVPDMGASVYVVTDNNQALAQRYADQLGAWIFERRSDWHAKLLSTRQALLQAKAKGRYPVIFADTNDNTGGGAPGDSTGMLRAFLEAELQDACLLYMVDPEAVFQCQQAGVGATLALDIGGKSSHMQGKPVPMRADLMALSEGLFKYGGPMYRGLVGNMGPSAYIKQRGLHVLLVTQREQPYDPAFARTMGLDPRNMRYIGIKSTAHFRAGFEGFSKAIYLVSEPGVHDPNNIRYHHLGRKVYPVDDVSPSE